jgi:hypothetical protein
MKTGNSNLIYESPRFRIIVLKLENHFLASQTDLEGATSESVEYEDF